MKCRILKVLVGMLLLLGGSPGLGASKDDEDHKRRYQSLIRMAPNDASRDAEVIAKRLGTDVPALIKALKDENPSVRRVASDTLGTMGANAKAAVPTLMRIFKDENAVVMDRISVGVALERFAPNLEGLGAQLEALLTRAEQMEAKSCCTAPGNEERQRRAQDELTRKKMEEEYPKRYGARP